METAAQQGGGARGCQSKKVDDSTMLAPPTFPVSLPDCQKRLARETGATRGRSGVRILPEVSLSMCVRVDREYL